MHLLGPAQPSSGQRVALGDPPFAMFTVLFSNLKFLFMQKNFFSFCLGKAVSCSLPTSLVT